MSAPDQQQAVAAKIRSYEEFANERLRGDLRKVLEARDAIFSDIAEYQQLGTVIEKLREQRKEKPGPEQTGEIKTMVDLGANFYVHAKVPDTRHVFVAVGFGFYVEFTHDEALEFIEKKVEQLEKEGRRLSGQASEIRARIQLVVEALNELTFSNRPERAPPRAVW